MTSTFRVINRYICVAEHPISVAIILQLLPELCSLMAFTLSSKNKQFLFVFGVVAAMITDKIVERESAFVTGGYVSIQ